MLMGGGGGSPAQGHGRRLRLHSQSGLSLVEAMVAVALLGIGLLPVAYIQSSGTRNSVTSYGVVAASALAAQLSDKAMGLQYTDSRLTATTEYVTPSSTITEVNPLNGAGTHITCPGTSSCGFTRKWKITDNSPIANTKRIDVKLDWNSYGIARSFTLSTILAVR